MSNVEERRLGGQKRFMKPLLAEEQDGVTLQNLGRASLQIIHDIKNQLNGLKLYATFLRKRMEKIDQSEEDQETVMKLIAGLDRAAGDLTVLVQYGRPLRLNKQKGIDVQKLLRGVAVTLSTAGDSPDAFVIDWDSSPVVGEFDPTALTDALKAIAQGALRTQSRDYANPLSVKIRRESLGEQAAAIIEWQPVLFNNGDPFRAFNGSEAIRMSLAAKIIEAHKGSAEYQKDVVRIRLPLAPE
jgi:light-regulated signal transduction histidine kinase (bacteriophytochrome)